MNLPRCLHWWRAPQPALARRPAVPDWVNACGEPAEPPTDEVRRGCGWFDSSHELHTGLQVTEHLTPEPVANEVPLGWWLDWQSCGDSATAKLQPPRQGFPRARVST